MVPLSSIRPGRPTHLANLERLICDALVECYHFDSKLFALLFSFKLFYSSYCCDGVCNMAVVFRYQFDLDEVKGDMRLGRGVSIADPMLRPV